MPHSFVSANLVLRAISEVPPGECREHQLHHEDDSEYRESLGGKGLLRRHAAEGTTTAIRRARPVLALRRAGYERCPVSQAQRHSCERTSPSERADGRAVPAGCSPTRTTETSLHPAKIEQMFPSYGPAVRTRIHAAFHRRAQPSCIGLGQGGGPKRLSDADARAAS